MRYLRRDVSMYYMLFLRRFAPHHAAAATPARAGLEGSCRAAYADGRSPGRTKRLRGAARFVRFREARTARSALREHLREPTMHAASHQELQCLPHVHHVPPGRFRGRAGAKPQPTRRENYGWRRGGLQDAGALSVYAARAGGARDLADVADGWFIHQYH
jgi:hypothetical protein